MPPPEWRALSGMAKASFSCLLMIHECIIADMPQKCNRFY